VERAVALGQELSKLPVPQWPSAFKTVAEFGRAIGWGGSSAEARAQILNITKESVMKMGFTYNMAEEWLEFYVNVSIRNPGNPSAAGRAELMLAIMDLLK
jgi:hypothetical protein